jgi:4-diphosphocytidyl-2-C-methyl-D-erythritol kinase
MSGHAARILAQAKINLALRVFGLRPDGYHSIETVFLRLELGDDVEVRITRGEKSVRCFEMRDKRPEENLAYRAAELYAKETGWPKGFEIEIVKNIPLGGGLGGGSADAAGVLRILNTLATTPVGYEKLLDMAAVLGSDVPFLAGDQVMGARREDAGPEGAAAARGRAFLSTFRRQHRRSLRDAGCGSR